MVALVLAGVPPAYMLADERSRILVRKPELQDQLILKREEAETTMKLWQGIWNTMTKGAWTRRLLPDVRRRVRKKNEVTESFHLAQTLADHGCFRQYLYKRRRSSDSVCVYCGALETR